MSGFKKVDWHKIPVPSLSKDDLDSQEGECPKCKKRIVLVRKTGLIAPHNESWYELDGVRWPVRCPGGGSKPVRN